MTRQEASGLLGLLALLIVGGAGVLCVLATRSGKRSGYTAEGFWHWWGIVVAYGVVVGAAAGVGLYVYSVEALHSASGGLLGCALFSSVLAFMSSQAIFGTYCGTIANVRFRRELCMPMYLRQLRRSAAIAGVEIVAALVAHLAGAGR